MKELLGFHLKENLSRQIHLKESQYYDRLLFYQFLQQTRVRNSHNLPYWGMVTAADAYARGDGESTIQSTVHSGYSTTISTFLGRTQKWREEMKEKISKLLQSKSKHLCCLDNNKKNFGLTYHQRGGKSSKYVKVTGTTVIKEFFSVDPVLTNVTSHVQIKYINQPIPSPSGIVIIIIPNNQFRKYSILQQ